MTLSDAVVYSYQVPERKFGPIQNLTTRSAHCVEFYSVAGTHYLAVANHALGYTYSIDSHIYEFDPSTQKFVLAQTLATVGAIDFEAFRVGGVQYLAVANYREGEDFTQDSKVYVWHVRWEF